MKTIELDLERDGQLESLSGLIRKQKIEVGEDPFDLRIHAVYDMSQILYAALLLLLVKYFIDERNKVVHGAKPDLIYREHSNYYLFYFKNYDTSKLESKIEKDFKVNIEIDKKNPLDDVFGIWKHFYQLV